MGQTARERDARDLKKMRVERQVIDSAFIMRYTDPRMKRRSSMVGTSQQNAAKDPAAARDEILGDKTA